MQWHRRRKDRWFLVGLIWFGMIPCGGCLRATPSPLVPDSPVEKAARDAVVTYAHHLADSFDDAGTQLQSRTLTTAADVNQHLQTGNAAARRQAFQDLDQLLNDELGGEKWDAARARQLFEHISSGFRSLP